MPLPVILIIAAAGLSLIWLVYQVVWGTPPSINLAVERLSIRMVRADPEMLTYLGMLDNTLLDFHSGKLTNVSPQYMADLQKLDRDGLALIQRFDPDKLKGQKQITYRLMAWYFAQNLQGHRFEYHWVANPVFMGPYLVNHVFGVQVDLVNFLSTYHKFKGRRSVRRYVQRLQSVDWKLDGLIESLNVRADQEALPPKFVIEKSLAQIEDFLSRPINENPLYTHFVEGSAQSGKFSEDAQHRWADRVKSAITQDVFPAYERLQTTLQDMLEKATTDDGIWKLPGGKAYYDFLLRNHTTTNLTAEEIHQLGLDEVAKLTQMIRDVLIGLGLPADEPGKQLKALMKDPQHHYFGESRRQAILDDYQDILDDVNAHMPQIFTRGSLDEIVVKRLAEYKEPDSPIAYAQAPAMDGSRPGTMWINLRDPGNVYRWGMRTLAYHEGIPGHVYQMAQAQKLKGIPTFRRLHFFNAYVEGWALYAERLGWELNLSDALSNLGRLQALLWRAARLVVDTGIHAKRWTRARAIDYMVETTGMPERDMITEVERYIVMPGQACAYYLGYLKILSLREKAQAILGEAFHLKDFHDVVINNGGLPLILLEEAVNDYVDRTAGLKPGDVNQG